MPIDSCLPEKTSPVKSPDLRWVEVDSSASSEFSHYVVMQGSVMRASRRERAEFDAYGRRGGPRAVVREFSAASQKSLTKLLHGIDWAAMVSLYGVPGWLTLTYPRLYAVEFERWKANHNHFMTYVERELGIVSSLWRIERQKRGAPHFHLILWCSGVDLGDAAQLAAVEARLQRIWFDVVGSGDAYHLDHGCRLLPLDSVDQVIRYVTKYASKTDDAGVSVVFDYPIGRYWGKRGARHLVMCPVEVMELTPEGFKRLRRILRRLCEARRRLRGCSRYRRPPGRTQVDELYRQGIWTIVSPDVQDRLLRFLGDAILKLSCPSVLLKP